MEDTLTGLGIIIAILLSILLLPITIPIMIVVGIIKLPAAIGRAVRA